MNERIQKLLDQCQTPVADVFGVVQCMDTDLKKFGLLIVQECCARLEAVGDEWQEFADRPPAGQEHNASAALFAAHRLREDAVEEIKQHFGVD